MAPILYIRDAFYVFGGYATEPVVSDIIWRLNQNGQWAQAGKLQVARRAHNAIFDGQYVVVVGGNASNLPTEICSIKDDSTISCTSQEPTLSNYNHFPELYLVENSFCKIYYWIKTIINEFSNIPKKVSLCRNYSNLD